MLELDRLGDLAECVRPLAATSPANSWHGLLALCRDAEAGVPLLDVARRIRSDDDTFAVFTAMAAEVAARTEDAGSAIGAWSISQPLGDSTIVLGLGTVVMGFARHFTDSPGGRPAISTAPRPTSSAPLDLPPATVLSLWRGHSVVELAEPLARKDHPADQERAEALLADVRNGVPSSPRLARRCDEAARGSSAHCASERRR